MPKGPNLTKPNSPKKQKVRSSFQSIPKKTSSNKISPKSVAKATVLTETILKASKEPIPTM